MELSILQIVKIIRRERTSPRGETPILDKLTTFEAFVNFFGPHESGDRDCLTYVPLNGECAFGVCFLNAEGQALRPNGEPSSWGILQVEPTPRFKQPERFWSPRPGDPGYDSMH